MCDPVSFPMVRGNDRRFESSHCYLRTLLHKNTVVAPFELQPYRAAALLSHGPGQVGPDVNDR